MSEQRKLSTDALETLGTIINESAGRDAIHLAVEPSIAAHPLRPGDHVGFVEGGVGICDAPVGIVDPFLKAPVRKGERFWLVVYPRQITSLRHVWTHPAFENKASEIPSRSKDASERWLREFITTADCPNYERVIAAAISDDTADDEFGSYNEGGYLHFRGSDAHGDIPPEFWDHVEIVTGKKIPGDRRATYFSCSC
jgi:hypothetical protein